jgi:pilus assembly protein Flp/PilA
MKDLLFRMLVRFQSEKGQTMVEYGLILALVSVVAIVILGTLGTNVSTTFQSASDALGAV